MGKQTTKQSNTAHCTSETHCLLFIYSAPTSVPSQPPPVSTASASGHPQPYTGDYISLSSPATSAPLPPISSSTPSPSTSQPTQKHKRRKSSRKSKKRSPAGMEVTFCSDPSLYTCTCNSIRTYTYIFVSQGVAGGVNPSSLRGQSHMSSEQVQSEIQAIDSILQALSTGDYGLASMRGVAQLTGAGEATASQVTPPSHPHV